jgi:hypothetical protein
MNIRQAFRRRDRVGTDWRAILVFSSAEHLPTPIRRDILDFIVSPSETTHVVEVGRFFQVVYMAAARFFYSTWDDSLELLGLSKHLPHILKPRPNHPRSCFPEGCAGLVKYLNLATFRIHRQCRSRSRSHVTDLWADLVTALVFGHSDPVCSITATTFPSNPHLSSIPLPRHSCLPQMPDTTLRL